MNTLDLTAKQVAEIANVPAPTFGHWLVTGLIRPIRAWGYGRGRRYVFSLANVVEAMVVTDLRNRHVPKHKLYAVVREIEKHRSLVESSKDMLTLVTDTVTARVIKGEQELAQFVRNFDGGPLIAVPLDTLREEALEKLHWMCERRAE